MSVHSLVGIAIAIALMIAAYFGYNVLPDYLRRKRGR
jgi:hypothetical protein